MKKERTTYWEIPHDSWTIYKYGEAYKIIYHKLGAKPPKYKQEHLFSDDEKIPLTNQSEERFSQSLSRTKNTIFEIAMCNEFTHFCTFTLDEKLFNNRYDLSQFRNDLSRFIRNMNRYRENKIEYLLIPEQHKNGAWHMHGLIKGLTDSDLRKFTLSETLPYSIRKQLKKGEMVYNWDKYSKKFGFFTATDIKSHKACSKYITKYITKDVLETNIESNKHTFFASKGLKRREFINRVTDSECPFSDWDFENEYIKLKWFDNKEDLQMLCCNYTINYQKNFLS